MVRLRSLDLACVFAGSQHRLLDDCAVGLGIREHLDSDQHHHDSAVHAMSRYDAQPHAAAGLAEFSHGGGVLFFRIPPHPSPPSSPPSALSSQGIPFALHPSPAQPHLALLLSPRTS